MYDVCSLAVENRSVNAGLRIASQDGNQIESIFRTGPNGSCRLEQPVNKNAVVETICLYFKQMVQVFLW